MSLRTLAKALGNLHRRSGNALLCDDQSTPRDANATGRGPLNANMTRRTIFRFAAQLAPGVLMAGRDDDSTVLPRSSSSDVRRMVRFPEKRELILLTDRAPQLETPLRYFRQDFTPNEAFFVRWHVAGIPTRVDMGLPASGRRARAALTVTLPRRSAAALRAGFRHSHRPMLG